MCVCVCVCVCVEEGGTYLRKANMAQRPQPIVEVVSVFEVQSLSLRSEKQYTWALRIGIQGKQLFLINKKAVVYKTHVFKSVSNTMVPHQATV